METAAAAVILALLLLLSLQLLASRAFRGKGLALAGRVRRGPSATDRSASLPAIVLAFARRAGAEPGAGLPAASYSQSGEIRLRRGGGFVPFVAWQVVGLGRPGFLWDARQSIGPVTRFRVIDAYVEGEGLLEVRALGSLPVARETGVETTLGEAYRYLAELPWAPDAILGNPDLGWRQVDDGLVEVKLDTRVGTARVAFRFDAAGDIVAMEARDRPARDAKGRAVHYDWRGSFGEYTQIGPRRVPAYGEVGYVYPSGYEIYFRARISEYRLLS